MECLISQTVNNLDDKLNSSKEFLKLSTPSKTVFVNKETTKTASLTVNFEAQHQPNFTWYDNKDEIIYVNKTVQDNYKYDVRETSNEIILDFQFVDYHCFGNFTLKAELWNLSQNITVELIVSGN